MSALYDAEEYECGPLSGSGRARRRFSDAQFWVGPAIISTQPQTSVPSSKTSLAYFGIALVICIVFMFIGAAVE